MSGDNKPFVYYGVPITDERAREILESRRLESVEVVERLTAAAVKANLALAKMSAYLARLNHVHLPDGSVLYASEVFDAIAVIEAAHNNGGANDA